MRPKTLPPEFLEKVRAITAKRPKTVIEHILERGFVTTEELRSVYGYHHPPRAARDVREQGIPLETFAVVDSNGRKIAAYRFADLSKVRAGFLGGRRIFSKEFKQALAATNDSRCSVCLGQFEERYLQVDHCVPYEVAGDIDFDEKELESYMLLCRSCNRAKSWSCEHCENWLEAKEAQICRACYWGAPNAYVHIALRPERRLDLVWSDKEVAIYDKIRELATESRESVPDFVKRVLAKRATHS